jgi:hypothetical protein
MPEGYSFIWVDTTQKEPRIVQNIVFESKQEADKHKHEVGLTTGIGHYTFVIPLEYMIRRRMFAAAIGTNISEISFGFSPNSAVLSLLPPNDKMKPYSIKVVEIDFKCAER